MSGIKQLAGQTIWYGGSSVLTKMLTFLLTPILTYLMTDKKGVTEFGDFSLVYAWVAVANIIFTYGLETGYFRFSNNPNTNQQNLFNTTLTSHIITTAVFSSILIYFSGPISAFLAIGTLPQIIVLTVLVIAFDTISTIPFAKLRQENKPRKYAFIKVLGVIVNVFIVLFFIYFIPTHFSTSNNSFAKWVMRQNRVTLLVLANLIQTIVTFSLLFKEWGKLKFHIELSIFKKIIAYSLPMIIIGLAGMVNEVMDRQMLTSFLTHSVEENKKIVAIYSASYKISIVITMFITAFRMAAEPFFFKQKNAQNAPYIYAKVMKWFVIVVCIAFLATALYLHIWQYMLGKEYRGAIYIVPYLLLANVFLGIYYNLSAWYKITDKMYWGIIITVIGAIFTFFGNYIFIPYFEMYASAITTMLCYGLMVILAYKIGQKHYPVPYSWKKLLAYIIITVLLFLLCQWLNSFFKSIWIQTFISSIFMLAFLLFVARIEKKEMQKMPVIGRFFR